MAILNKYDGFNNGTVKQYKTLIQISDPGMSVDEVEILCKDCIIRKGVFWSEKYHKLIAGHWEDQRVLGFYEYEERLIETIKVLSLSKIE